MKLQGCLVADARFRSRPDPSLSGGRHDAYPVRHHKPCGSQAGTGHNLTKRGGVLASPSRLAPDGATMAGLPEVIGLLYRADWTRLSLAAELRSETDRAPLPGLPREGRSRWYRAWPGQGQDNGRYVARGAL